MAGYNVIQPALRLSAIVVAAGTILGLSATATAQSRLERAERALQKAQEELNAAQRQADQGGDQKVELQCERGCQNCDGRQARDGDERQIELSVTTDDDDDDAADQARDQRRIERKIIRHGDGEHVCPLCGKPMDDDGPRAMQFRRQPDVQVFGLGGSGNARVETRGKVIILDDNGQRREFNFGGDGPGMGWFQGTPDSVGPGNRRIEIRRSGGDSDGPGVIEWKSDGDSRGGEKRIEIRRMDGDGPTGWKVNRDDARVQKRIEIRRSGGDEPGVIEWKSEGDGGNADMQKRIEIRRSGGEGESSNKVFRVEGGDHAVTGKVIIIGPDGQRREFDLGGHSDTGAGPSAAPRVHFEELRDGDAAPAHLDQGGGQGGERRVIQVRRVSRGQAC